MNKIINYVFQSSFIVIGRPVSVQYLACNKWRLNDVINNFIHWLEVYSLHYFNTKNCF